MTTKRQRLRNIDDGITVIIDHLEKPQPSARPISVEPGSEDRFAPTITNPTARVAILAVALNLKNRADATTVEEGSHVEAVIKAYADVQELRDLLGRITDNEVADATALYDDLATGADD